MRVVLIKDDKKLGKIGDVVSVKDGYAVNYLIPKGIAEYGTREKIIAAKKKKSRRVEKAEEKVQKVGGISRKVKNKKVKISAKTSSGGITFASISEKEIVEELVKSLKLSEEDIEVSIDLAKPIKEIGKYPLDVMLTTDGKKEKSNIILEVVSK